MQIYQFFCHTVSSIFFLTYSINMASWHVPVHDSASAGLEEDPFDENLELTFPPMRYSPMFYNSQPPLPSKGGQRLRRESSRERDRLYRELVGHEPYKPPAKGELADQGEKFCVRLDVKHYRPDEITVKVDGQTMTITGKHRNEIENGYEACEFQRKYTIPEHIDTHTLTSNISQDGILTIEAAKKISLKEGETEDSEEKENYHLSLDVSGYAPDEISIRVNGRDLIIRGEAKDEHNSDHGKSIHHRHFTWHYNLPSDINVEALSSRYTKDSKLAIEAPRGQPLETRTLEIMKE